MGESFNCRCCGKIYTRTSQRKNIYYCSNKCYLSHIKGETLEVKCSFCGECKRVHKNERRRYSNHFCNTECFKKFRQRHNKKTKCNYCGIDIVVPKSEQHFGASYCNRDCKILYQKETSTNYITISRNNLPQQCNVCGITCEGLLSTHHIDGNRENNELENLEVLCANHHITRHLSVKNGGWVYSTRYLTDRNMLEKIYNLMQK